VRTKGNPLRQAESDLTPCVCHEHSSTNSICFEAQKQSPRSLSNFQQKLASVVNPGNEIVLDNEQAWHAMPVEIVLIHSFQ
jgi:hypothetical protein